MSKISTNDKSCILYTKVSSIKCFVITDLTQKSIKTEDSYTRKYSLTKKNSSYSVSLPNEFSNCDFSIKKYKQCTKAYKTLLKM